MDLSLNLDLSLRKQSTSIHIENTFSNKENVIKEKIKVKKAKSKRNAKNIAILITNLNLIY